MCILDIAICSPCLLTWRFKDSVCPSTVCTSSAPKPTVNNSILNFRVLQYHLHLHVIYRRSWSKRPQNQPYNSQSKIEETRATDVWPLSNSFAPFCGFCSNDYDDDANLHYRLFCEKYHCQGSPSIPFNTSNSLIVTFLTKSDSDNTIMGNMYKK